MTVSYEDAVREATDYLAEADLHLARTGRLPSIPLPADLLRALLSPEQGWREEKDKNARQIMTDACQILDVVKGEWGSSWSDFDQGVRDRITAWLRDHYAPPTKGGE